MNLETTRLKGRPRIRRQDEVREDERLAGGKGWKERVYNREERKKLLRTARNRRILNMPMEWTNDLTHICMHKKSNDLQRRGITALSLNVFKSAVKLRYKTLQNTSLAHNVHLMLSVLPNSTHTVPITITPKGTETKPSPESSTVII